MKIDKRALSLFKIDKEIFIITICKFIIFLSFLFFTYNFVDLLFKIINNNFSEKYFITFGIRTIFIFALYYVALFIDNKLSHTISEKVRNNLRKEIYEKVEKLSLNYTEAVSTSNLLVMNSTSIVNIELYFNKFIPQIYATLLIIVSSLFIFGSISFWLALAMLILYPLIPISIMVIMKKSKKTNKKTFSDFLSLSEVFFDRLKGFSVAKIYGKENNIANEIDKSSENYRKSTMVLLKHQLNSINVMDAITYISIFTMSIIAISTLNNPVLIIFVIVASFECFRPLRALGALFHISMKASVELDNIYKLLDYKENNKDDSLKVKPYENISINNMNFSYDNEHTILNNINMEFKKSSKTALVGESGSGKSTIIKLIMGLKKASSGSVLYGNKEIANIPFKELTKIMTVITSDSYLQADIIRNHLTVRENISEEEMFSALEKVNLKDLVIENGGLDYKLTEGAANLSGGQKQRLLAAKAILKDSYIYILDEAVSNIDDYSKNCVLSAFDSIKENKILIIISHDLEVLANCDNIYVLKNGEIIEQGSNNDLLENNNLYSTLLNEQINLKNKFFAKEEF
ncbi:ABC transporter ATP-binding protein/permease [Gemelliphila palaticanis]|uniref:ATP-binding cassette domain-containing protein n=1 Tax=Gemelliphila palaticanis TaxID=81950 RepID=A0ABX2SY96_9BACL|nr:ATP-binding cassette domain-containing protein [Gemella palaticanis]MBF0715352.1 ATP-binding cassette domain-containing protein [Gemella palaticanis]NYS47282.1 ATP-binding cassette domain-containing protein [Gemella palaticanis]